ncbi:MAG: rhomboid family intramembrane serine protease [Planctomycetes bacterium]|nr:rhomboid family intramembrane serine protease [Planctomycetota bacterium]
MHHDAPRFSLPALPPAIRFLLVANVAVFLANMVLVGRLSDPADGSGFWFAFSWNGLWEGYGLGLVRLVTYQFTHSFRDPMHLLLNVLVLWFFGAMVEARLGVRGTLRLYLIGGAAGALLHLAIAAIQGQASVPLIGASGACYAFLLYATVLAPRTQVLLVFVPVPLWGLAALLVGLGAYGTFVEFATGTAGGVSHGAHLGGAAFGALAAKAGWFVAHGGADAGAGWLASWRQRLAARRQGRTQQAAAAREDRLDAILAKVKLQGLGALSPAERRFLEQQSERSRRGS